MSESFVSPRLDVYHDMVPWADPYIASLLQKLGCELDEAAELPPPRDHDDPQRDDDWEADWSRRNWPRYY